MEFQVQGEFVQHELFSKVRGLTREEKGGKGWGGNVNMGLTNWVSLGQESVGRDFAFIFFTCICNS